MVLCFKPTATARMSNLLLGSCGRTIKLGIGLLPHAELSDHSPEEDGATLEGTWQGSPASRPDAFDVSTKPFLTSSPVGATPDGDLYQQGSTMAEQETSPISYILRNETG